MYPYSLITPRTSRTISVPTTTPAAKTPEVDFVDYEAPCPGCGNTAPWRATTINKEVHYGDTTLITNVRIDCTCPTAA
jgi:hypothetical protein